MAQPRKTGARKTRPLVALGSRQGFALPVLYEQLQPVLSTSPRSYMLAGATNSIDSTTTVPTSVTPVPPLRSVSPLPPASHRPKGRDYGSPRVMRAQQHPSVAAARVGVDLYRYHQATEQRMAIRPLFEERHEEQAALASQILLPDTTHEFVNDVEKLTGENDSLSDGDDEEFTRISFVPPMRSVAPTGNHEADTNSRDGPLNESVVQKPDALNPIENYQDRSVGLIGNEDIEPNNETPHHDASGKSDLCEEGQASSILNSPFAVKPLDNTNYHEWFLPVETPSVGWLKRAVDQSTRNLSQHTRHPNQEKMFDQGQSVFYKTLWKEMRTFANTNVLLTVLLGSDMSAHVAIDDRDGAAASHERVCANSKIAVTEADLQASKHARTDLCVFTPKWAEWIISKVKQDDNGLYFLQIDEHLISDNLILFSRVVNTNGEDIHVRMLLLGKSDLLVRVNRVGLEKTYEIVIRATELFRIALRLDKLPAEELEDSGEHLLSLLHDHDFLAQVVRDGRILQLAMRLGISNDENQSEREFSLNENHAVKSQFISEQVELKDETASMVVNSTNSAIAFLSQAYTDYGILSALRWFQQKNAVALYVHECVDRPLSLSTEIQLNKEVQAMIETAKQAKLMEIASLSIIDDMVASLISYECRIVMRDAIYSGGYDDFYASKLQSTFRMSVQRKSYEQQKYVRMRAARLVQALQRGIISRKRYSEMRIEREKYLFYGFRSSLHHSTGGMENPRTRALELAADTTRKRHNYLMQVLRGYISEHGIPIPFRIPIDLIKQLFNEYGVVVGCSTTFGDGVALYLDESGSDRGGLCTSTQINAALQASLRSQYDDTFGLSSTARRLNTAITSPKSSLTNDPSTDDTPPRWLLKISPQFQRSNRDRLATLRLSRQVAGRKAAHLVARDYRNLLNGSFAHFEKCRAAWESALSELIEQQKALDSFTTSELVQYALDKLIASIKDWGIDPEPLFEALNLCMLNREGREVLQLIELRFNEFAEGVNQMHKKKNILPLREEIAQELEDFEKLLALRCLDISLDHVIIVPPSEILHIILNGRVDVEYIRHALPSVLPIASIVDKYQLAHKMIIAYANHAYGEAFISICWSCLDVAENVTVEATQLLDRITRLGDDEIENYILKDATQEQSLSNNSQARGKLTTVASRALYLLTGLQAMRFLHFLAKVAHFNLSVQRRVLAHLKPHADQHEMYRLAYVLCSLDNYALIAQLFKACLTADALYAMTPFWCAYESTFGSELAQLAQAATVQHNG